jgi:hypothetical protein
MATLDETNIFGLTPNQPEKKDDSLSRLGISESGYLNRLAQIQNMQKVAEGVKEKSEKKYGLGIPLSQRSIERSDLIKQYTSDLAEAAKDPTQEKRDTALESFFETPFMFQMGQYIPDPTGLPTDIAEAEYSGRKFKESREARGKGTEFYPGPLGMGDRPFYPDMTPEEAGLKLQQGLAIGSIPPGIGGIAGIAQSIFGLPSKVLRSKTMDGQGGGSGGISEIPPEPKKDYSGFVSSVEKAALGPVKFGKGDDLIKYLESKSRSGISQKELEYIDFDQIRNNPDLTKEDVIKYIQDNRPQIYRVQRSEDNPTYRANESDNLLTFLPLDEETTRIANREQQDFFRDEYAQELAQHNEIITDNQTLRYSNYRLNSENINDPSVLEAVDNYLKYDPEAFNGVNPAVIQINYPDGKVAFFNNDDFVSGNNPEVSGYTTKDLEKVVKDGATIEFPALAQTDDIIEEASEMRVSPDFGNQIEVYFGVGDYTGAGYKIIGNENTEYRVMLDEELVEIYDDLADARARVESEAYENGDILEGADNFDTGSNPDQLLETAPFDVITGEATLPTKYGYQYENYRLPMGGAENYREFTLHIANPRTPTRYSADELGGVKHFGGGDELLHYRTTDRIDEDGKKVLFVEEIQSDLHESAGSPRKSANYETPIKERQKIANQLKEFGLRANTKELKGYGNLFYRGEPGTGGEKMIDIGALPSIAREIKAGRTSKFGSQKADDFVENFGFEKTQEIGALVEKLETGELPDYPFKGNDWIELAVKDIIKLADEGGYDRVAFTNAPTQIKRTNSNVNFVKDALVRRVPSIEEYAQSSQFKKDFDKAVETALSDARKFSNPNITKEELLNQPILTFTPVNPSTILRSIDQDVLKPLNTRGDEIHNFVLNEYFKNNNVRGKLPKYQVEKRSLAIDDKPDYLFTSDSKLADLISVDDGDFTYLETTDELLAEFPKKMHEQILKDIEAGNIPKSFDDAQIYELNFKEGDGKKYLDLYGSKLKGALNNVVKKLDKDNKPMIKNVLFGEYAEGVSPETLYESYLGATREGERYATTFSGNIKSLTDRIMLERGLKKHNAITIDITPKMKKTIAEEGVNVYAKGGIVNKVKSMDKPIQGNRREI